MAIIKSVNTVLHQLIRSVLGFRFCKTVYLKSKEDSSFKWGISTKGCGNAILIILMIKIYIYCWRNLNSCKYLYLYVFLQKIFEQINEKCAGINGYFCIKKILHFYGNNNLIYNLRPTIHLLLIVSGLFMSIQGKFLLHYDIYIYFVII